MPVEDGERIRLHMGETIQEDNILSVRATNIQDGDKLTVHIQALPETIDFSLPEDQIRVQLEAFWAENDHWAESNIVRNIIVDENDPYTTVEEGVLGRRFNLDGLMSETMYHISVVRWVTNPVTNSEETRKNIPDMATAGAIRIATTMLRNLQRYEVFDSQRAADTLPESDLINQAAIPANTHDTVNFNILFMENPEYMARFNINGDNMICTLDVTALQSFVNGNTDAMVGSRYTYVTYGATCAATPVANRVIRGDINKDGVVNQADVERLADILSRPSPPPQYSGVEVFILTRENFLAGRTGDSYRLNQFRIDETPVLYKDTLFTDLSFTGLQPNTEYTVVALVGHHNG